MIGRIDRQADGQCDPYVTPSNPHKNLFVECGEGGGVLNTLLSVCLCICFTVFILATSKARTVCTNPYIAHLG